MNSWELPVQLFIHIAIFNTHTQYKTNLSTFKCTTDFAIEDNLKHNILYHSFVSIILFFFSSFLPSFSVLCLAAVNLVFFGWSCLSSVFYSIWSSHPHLCIHSTLAESNWYRIVLYITCHHFSFYVLYEIIYISTPFYLSIKINYFIYLSAIIFLGHLIILKPNMIYLK